MKNKNQNKGKQLYDTLAFQYKPLEKQLEEILPKEQWNRYKKLSYFKKIHILDGVAEMLGY